MSKQKTLAVFLVLGLLTVVTVGFLVKQTTTARVTFSSGNTGYMCFLNYNDTHGGPLCLQDRENASLPFGTYQIVYFVTNIPQGLTFYGFTGTGGITTSGNQWSQYSDPFTYEGNMTVTGNGTLSVVWVTGSIPVPEFNGVAFVAFSALAAALYILRRPAKLTSR